MITLLCASKTLISPASAHRFKVELAELELVLDAQGVPVPASFKTIDVLVTEPTKEVIAALLAATGHLNGYQITNYWVPIDSNCF